MTCNSRQQSKENVKYNIIQYNTNLGMHGYICMCTQAEYCTEWLENERKKIL